MERKVFSKEMHRLWGSTKKDLNKVLKDGALLIKQGEIYIKDRSEKGKEKLEAMALVLQREKLYYELGKSLANLSKGKWRDSKRVDGFLIKIKNISRKITKANE